MKKVILLLCCFIALTSVYGQKVQLKKDKILVDKKEQFKFVKTKDGKLLKGTLPHLLLSQTDGKEVLIFTDTLVNFTQLPNEVEGRKAYRTFVCTNPKDNKSTVVGMPRSLNVRKYYMKELKKLDFFKSGELTSEIYDAFIATQNLEQVKDWDTHVDSTNINRLKNYELTKSKFGALTKRKPGKVSIREGAIRDGINEVGKFVISEKGSYAHTFEVVNKEGFTIAKSTLILKENNANTRSLCDNKIKRFFYKKNKDGSDPTPDEKLREMAEYLILQGYL